MTEPTDLPYLIALLGDDSVVVQAELKRAFCSLYDNLPEELENIAPLDLEQKNRLHALTETARRQQLLDQWPKWRNQETLEARLEFGLECIARYQNGILHPESVATLLGETAHEFRKDHPQADDPMVLARYLFSEPGLKGERMDYYSPRNSNLVHVLKTGSGNPISLTCIFALLGSRLGFDVQGCNYPGHFLARVTHQGTVSYVDCFSGGQVLDEQLTRLLRERTSESSRREILQRPVSAKTILTRILRNLINGYRLSKASAQADLFLFLVKATVADIDSPRELPLFTPGQLVIHRKYDYRGLVVDYDLSCTADDDWYHSNQSQPQKEQPWYRVLVHGTKQVTYAAQTSLMPDTANEPIEHPWVPVFFSEFESDSYIRNQRPWPER